MNERTTAMAIIQGNDVIIMADGTALAAAKSCSISVTADTIEVSSPMQGTWRQYLTARKQWTLTTSHLVRSYPITDTPIKNMLLRVGKTYTLRISVRGLPDDTLTGTAVCTECKITATRGSLVQGSFSWQGTGQLAETLLSTFDETFDNTYA